jgi:branched-chain amino acid transport system permease protein
MNVLLIVAGLMTLAAIYSTAALALNLQFGLGGMINFGLAAFFGIGAYAYALAVMPRADGWYTYVLGLALPWWVGTIMGGLVAATLALVVGLATLRIGGVYLAVVTLALAEMIRQLFINDPAIANGDRGLLDAPVPFSDVVTGRELPLLIAAIALVVLALSYVVMRRVSRSAFGRSLLAINQNEGVAKSLGVNVYRTKLKAFVLAAFFTGIAGVMYVWYLSILTPTLFGANITFTIFMALIIGGLGSNPGAVAGAVILIGLREALTYIKVDFIDSEQLSSLQDALQGLLLIGILLFWQHGVFQPRLRNVTRRTASPIPGATVSASTAGAQR